MAWIIWYLREAFTAMLCANLPLSRALIQRIFKIGQCTTEQSSLPMHHLTGLGGSTFALPVEPSAVISRKDSALITPIPISKPLPPLPLASVTPDEEYITIAHVPLEITCTTEVTVENHPAETDISSATISFFELNEHDEPSQQDIDAASIQSRPRNIVTTCFHSNHI